MEDGGAAVGGESVGGGARVGVPRVAPAAGDFNHRMKVKLFLINQTVLYPDGRMTLGLAQQ